MALDHLVSSDGSSENSTGPSEQCSVELSSVWGRMVWLVRPCMGVFTKKSLKPQKNNLKMQTGRIFSFRFDIERTSKRIFSYLVDATPLTLPAISVLLKQFKMVNVGLEFSETKFA